MKFYEKLQTLRKEKRLSQEELAEMLGVSRQSVSKWESGVTYPETDKLLTISEIFGVTLDSLLKYGEIENDTQNRVSDPYWVTRGRLYEYKSDKTLFGLPLVHINIGFGVKRAKGIIAIGNIATGFISIGLLSTGFLSFGLLSLGLIAFGILTLGLLVAIGSVTLGMLSIGGIALGVFTIGGVAIGVYSIGGLAIASNIAVGGQAVAPIAIGQAARGTYEFLSNGNNFSSISANEVRQAIDTLYPNTWNWVVNWMTWFLG